MVETCTHVLGGAYTYVAHVYVLQHAASPLPFTSFVTVFVRNILIRRMRKYNTIIRVMPHLPFLQGLSSIQIVQGDGSLSLSVTVS